MTPSTVTEMTADLIDTIRSRGFGLVAITGELHGWRTFRSGIATAELVDSPSGSRLRLYAARPAAISAKAELDDAGWNDGETAEVTAHGHIVFDPRWGVQIELLRLTVERRQDPQHHPDDRSRPNADLRWPTTIEVVGLITPSGGDDARSDVESVLADAGLRTIEYRIAVTGGRAPMCVAQSLDRLALDPRPDVTLLIRGGGPASDFTTFDHELVGIAIDRHRHPVVTGLGHATNHTLADRAAHTACITPTAAAQLVAQHADRPVSGGSMNGAV